MSGLLISFDGLDSSGKETQVKHLVNRLKTTGKPVLTFTTPDYFTPTGKRLKVLLQNKEGTWHDIPWQEKIKLFAENRYEHRDEVRQTLEQGGIVVYDRYVPSSLAFFAAELFGKEERKKVQQFIEQHEYQENGMPREAVSIFLDVPAEVADQLLHGRKQQNHDDHEYTDVLEFQHRLYTEYNWLCENQPLRMLRIPCVAAGQLDSVATIEERVWTALQQRLPALK